MKIEDRLRQLMELKSGNIRAFAIDADIKYTTLRSILERGVMKANVENIFKIAEHLGMTAEEIAELDTDNNIVGNIMDTVVQLVENRQQKVYQFAEYQLEEQNQTVKVYGQTAAGDPIECGQEIIEEKEVTYVPKNAEVALVINGDSMEPEFPDGSIVFYKRQPQVENGQIGIIEIDGGVTCKKIKFDYENEKIILQSLNDKYEDLVYEADEVKVLGLVVK